MTCRTKYSGKWARNDIDMRSIFQGNNLGG